MRQVDFLHWEVLQARGGFIPFVIGSLILLTLFTVLLSLAVLAVVGEWLGEQGFWIVVLTVMSLVSAFWFKVVAELIQIRYLWETEQDLAKD